MAGFLGSNGFSFFSNGGPQIPSGIITGSVSPSFVPYANGANTLANTAMTWDAVNNRIGINNATPAQALDVTGSLIVSANIYTSLTQGSVAFIDGSGLLTQDNANFFWNNTSKRLGIGTALPTFKLDIHGTGISLGVNGTTTNDAYMVFQNAGTSKWRLGNTYSAAANYFSIYDTTNSLDRLTILSSGFVGIGTSTPSVLLHVNSAASPAFRLVDTTQGANKVLISDANGNASWSALSGLNIPTGTGAAGQSTFWTGTNTLSGDNAYFWDNTNKRLGIGTATPSVSLHINSASSPAFRLVDGTQGAGKLLQCDANGNAAWAALSSIFGSGTTNYVPRFTAATTIGNSTMQDDGSNLGVATVPNVAYTMDVGGTVRIQQSVTMVASGNYYVGIGIAPSSNGRLNVYANSITGIYITGNSTAQKGIDLNGTKLAMATYSGNVSYLQTDVGGGNMDIKSLGNIALYPDILTSASAFANIALYGSGGAGYYSSLGVGAVVAAGDLVAGNAPNAGAQGSGSLYTVDPATGAKNTNGWQMGNVTAGAVVLDTTRYVRIDIGNALIKFLIAP